MLKCLGAGILLCGTLYESVVKSSAWSSDLNQSWELKKGKCLLLGRVWFLSFSLFSLYFTYMTFFTWALENSKTLKECNLYISLFIVGPFMISTFISVALLKEKSCHNYDYYYFYSCSLSLCYFCFVLIWGIIHNRMHCNNLYDKSLWHGCFLFKNGAM
uniref:Uncharacterized protein n=1 Tax=Fundulus heteroclitus TaxID=8078 RepID=A0A146R0E1_FUNHE